MDYRRAEGLPSRRRMRAYGFGEMLGMALIGATYGAWVLMLGVLAYEWLIAS